jgi:3-deoxy-D-manno-octulosonic-acid transferase
MKNSFHSSGRLILPWLYRKATAALSHFLKPFIFRGAPNWTWEQQDGFSEEMVSERSCSGLVWFHAASSGELEMLWSVARSLRQLPEFSNCQFGLTVFSPSGRTRLERFQSEFSSIYCGPSPWEGEWRQFFCEIRTRFGAMPSVFISAKYECWPDLWGTLLEVGVPVLMVNAEWRRSLRWGTIVTRALFGGLPRLKFFTVLESAARELSGCMPGESALCSGDPRWDQMVARLSRPHPRVQELQSLGKKAKLPRPWVILGSAWEEDLEMILSAASGASFSGTLWVVPHRPSAAQAREWVDRAIGAKSGGVWLSARVPGELRPLALDSVGVVASGLSSVEGSVASDRPELDHPRSGPQLVFVQELGVLAELYSIGDAAWVGGGFRTGLHSVIEPALSDLWIAAGASKADTFPEVPELTRLGQLDLIRTESQAAAWLQKIASVPSPSLRESWREWRVRTHLGAARRIASAVAEIVSGPGPV